ncbi:unnamed protein product [Rhizopus stolonifer]
MRSSETTRDAPMVNRSLGEDIVQSMMKVMELLNWFVPLMIGAPDYTKYNAKRAGFYPAFLPRTATRPGACIYLFNTLTFRGGHFVLSAQSESASGKLNSFEAKGPEVTNLRTVGPEANKKFGAYLAGLWEGDGSIWIPKTTHAPSGKRYTPHFYITFHDKDYPLVLALQKLIGGTIRNKSENHAYVLIISSINGLQNVIYLMNGYLRTPKVHQFNKLIQWINTKPDGVGLDPGGYSPPGAKNFSTEPIVCNDVDTSPIISNAWLSGFIDADGSFDVKVREKSSDGKGKNRAEARLRIEQRIIDQSTQLSYYSVIKSIASSLGVELNTSLHNEGIEYYIVSVTSPAKLKTLINYLDTYPLFSSKLLNYLDFKSCVNLMLSREHLTEQGRDNIKTIKAGMNRKRTYYTWDHLEKLSDPGRVAARGKGEGRAEFLEKS